MPSVNRQADSDNLKKSADSLEDTNELIKKMGKNQLRNIILGGIISGTIVLLFSRILP